ncbi:MAG: tail fiber domain-containing protein [Flavobacteriales bacterium]|nr:tail fiber domain-containing protein [Flavobacteriales bacterium]
MKVKTIIESLLFIFLPFTTFSQTYWELGVQSTTGESIGTFNAQPFSIWTSNLPRVTIGSGGNLGIGLTNPAYRLDVNGGDINLSADQYYRINGNSVLFADDSYFNVAVGVQSDINFSVSNFCRDNTFVGYHSGFSTDTASYNTFLGSLSGTLLENGQYNVAVGSQAGASMVDDGYNTFIGHQAGHITTGTGLNGDHNTFVGNLCGLVNTTGKYNTFVGSRSGKFNTVGYENVVIGFEAGNGLTDGDYNVMIGTRAGNAFNGNSNTFVGTDTDCGSVLSNATAIGYRAFVEASNALVLGGISGFNSGTSTNVGIGTTTPDNRLEIVKGAQGSNVSGLRLWSLVGSTPAAPSTGVLSINGSGDVILVATGGSGGGFGNYCSNTPVPLSENYEVPLDSANFYFTGQKNWVDNIGMGLNCNTQLMAKLHVYQEKWTQEYVPHDPNNSYAGMFEDNADDNTYWGVAVAGVAYGQAEWNFGGIFSAVDGIDHSIGIYASAPVDSGVNYAAFINGDGVYTGTWTHLSDGKLKTDIRDLTGLERLMRLSPKSYRFNTEKFPSMNLAQGTNYGLIAQEVENVIPEIVQEIVHPAKMYPNGEIQFEAIECKGINYIGLIPLTIAAIQEQQALIESKEVRIVSLEKEVKEMKQQLALLLK